MRPGLHAAADGSFGRSAGAAMGRGVLLLALALVLGIVLLNATDDQPPGTGVSAGASSGSDDKGDDKPTGTTTSTTTTLPARAPAEVKVLVVNASDAKGAAKGASDKLKAAQYNALAPGNSPKVAESAVFYTAGFDREATAIAGVLEIPATLAKPLPTPSPVPDLKTANVLVVLGADHANRFATAPASTTTTAKAGTASTTTTTAKAAASTTTTTAR